MAGARSIVVFYCHQEADGWWAESPMVPGFTAVAQGLEELQEQVRGGVRFVLGEDHPSAYLYILSAEPAQLISEHQQEVKPEGVAKPTSGANAKSELIFTP